MKKLKTHELNRLGIEAYKNTEKLPIVVILDNVRSMHNVGSVFRTSDAFLVEEIILCGITPQPPHREINKTALGATESVTWRFEEDIKALILLLKKQGYIILGIEQTDNSLSIQHFSIDKTRKYAIIFGNEVDGISDEIIKDLDYSVEIPQYGTKHSLNVSVAAGIVLFTLSTPLIKNK